MGEAEVTATEEGGLAQAEEVMELGSREAEGGFVFSSFLLLCSGASFSFLLSGGLGEKEIR